jgi:hypothetical protein
MVILVPSKFRDFLGFVGLETATGVSAERVLV